MLRPGGLTLRDGWRAQALLFAGAYLAYGASRWLISGDHASAVEHARWIVELDLFDIVAGAAITGVGYALAQQLPRISARPIAPAHAPGYC